MTREVEKLICMPTQHYDVPSGRIGNWYVGILLTEIDGIRNHHWDTERVIIFQTVILKNISQVSGSRNICDQIYSRLDLCNKSAYDELVQDS